jgi:hypothetical protein
MLDQSRRNVLTALIALPALASCATPAAAATPAADTRHWDAALAEYRRVFDAHSAAWDAYWTAQEAAFDDSPPFPEHLSKRFFLTPSMEPDMVKIFVRTAADVPGQPFDIDAVVAEWEAHRSGRAAANAFHRTVELDAAATAWSVPFHTARDGLMAIPAPTTAALLVKIEIASTSLDDDHADATLADARRLLGGADHA